MVIFPCFPDMSEPCTFLKFFVIWKSCTLRQAIQENSCISPQKGVLLVIFRLKMVVVQCYGCPKNVPKNGSYCCLTNFSNKQWINSLYPPFVINDSSWKNAAESFTVSLTLTLGGYESAIAPEHLTQLKKKWL